MWCGVNKIETGETEIKRYFCPYLNVETGLHHEKYLSWHPSLPSLDYNLKLS
jgi:hypothetical protein